MHKPFNYILRSGLTKDGKGHFVDVTFADAVGTVYVGRTRNMRTWPAMSRAVIAAENIAHRNAKARGLRRAQYAIR